MYNPSLLACHTWKFLLPSLFSCNQYIISSLSSLLQVPVESEKLIDNDLVLEQNISPALPVMAGFRLDGFSAIKPQLTHSPYSTINSMDASSIVYHHRFLSPAVLHIQVFASQVLSTPKMSCICKYRNSSLFVNLLGVSVAERKAISTSEPLLLNVVHGEYVERPPVWLMRQARSFFSTLDLILVFVWQSYQTLCEKHPSFRERSENVDLVVEISLQPWKVFKPNEVILFSDILTPLLGMNIFDPISTADDVAQVNNEAAVLGFVGAPFTLASYVVEGGSSKNFTKIKKLAFSQPEYQADKGAQAVQIFDSWAKVLGPVDFEEFSLPYLKQIVDTVKQTHPTLPLILYASGSGGLLERLPLTGVDVVSLDWTVDMAEGRKRLGTDIAVQGNVDPGVLFGS
ncbi:uroporphyrinogen decarboxylase protein [Artemisia annua]|uniref:Uroporphyrinogen decarboxylase protein n=1 Tax=Artemisia annua TaxID=35608 RepID=A0A2U1NMD2_ARTAN|nr:uroporphyrinogen decarboxylase protein [Artemisia annua]